MAAEKNAVLAGGKWRCSAAKAFFKRLRHRRSKRGNVLSPAPQQKGQSEWTALFVVVRQRRLAEPPLSFRLCADGAGGDVTQFRQTEP